VASRIKRIPAERARRPARLDKLCSAYGKRSGLFPGHRQPHALPRLGVGLQVFSETEQGLDIGLGFGGVDLVRDKDDPVEVVVITDPERANYEIGFAERLESKFVT
jgi:hypothetical protein